MVKLDKSFVFFNRHGLSLRLKHKKTPIEIRKNTDSNPSYSAFVRREKQRGNDQISIAGHPDKKSGTVHQRDNGCIIFSKQETT